jgi:heptosyltransferase-2
MDPEKSPNPFTIGSVVIRVPNWVGDAVMALPSLRELRRIFSKSKVALLAAPRVAGLFDNEGLADQILVMDAAGGLFSTPSRFISSVRTLRRERFDVAVLLQIAFGAALIARSAGLKTIAGYPTDSRGPLLDLTVPFEPDYKSLHQVRYYLNVAANIERTLTGASEVDLDNLSPIFECGDETRSSGNALLARFGVANPNQIAAINPGATNSRAKKWLSERFAKVADKLASDDGFQPVIIGSAGDAEAAAAVAANMKVTPIDLTGRTTIAELKAVLSCCRVLISNDTGPAHIAAALRVPTVVIFGSTEHHSTRPLSDLAAVVRHHVECSPCMLRDCPVDHRCMTRVGVDEVYLAARELIAAAPANSLTTTHSKI